MSTDEFTSNSSTLPPPENTKNIDDNKSDILDSVPTEKNDNDDMNGTTDESENTMDDLTNIIVQATTFKTEGNTHFQSGNLTLASQSYRKGTSLLLKRKKSQMMNNDTGSSTPLLPDDNEDGSINNITDGDDPTTVSFYEDEQVKSLLISLQTNLSMVCYKQNKHVQSRDIATKALDVDQTNVKALYRRALAHRKLKDYDSAKQDLKNALSYDPSNTAVHKELLSLQKDINDQKSNTKKALSRAFSSGSSSFLYDDKEAEEKKRLEQKKAQEEAEKIAREKRKVEWEEECVHRMARGEQAISFDDWEKEVKKKKEEDEKARKKAKKEQQEKERAEKKKNSAVSKSKSISNDDDNSSDDDELTESELKMMRGYKTTKDGKVTSYFTREQTDEEKMLLGSIAPQRLDTPPIISDVGVSNTVPALCPSPISPDASLTSTASAWNQAGTWEEKNTSDWCNKTLERYLRESSIKYNGKYLASIKKVNDLSGDASVAFVSGKKRYVFDYHTELKYEIIDDEVDEVIASGSFVLPDISSTAISDEIEVDIKAWKKAPKGNNVDDAIKSRDMLVSQVRLQVMDFVKAFNEQY